MVPRIKRVIPLPDFHLETEFLDGTIKEFDVHPYIQDFEMFRPIKNVTFFNTVRVIDSGFAVAWNEEIDIDRYDIWELGKTLASQRV